MTAVGFLNIAAVLLMLIGVLALGAWMGWRACQVNTRQHGLVVTSDRDVAANDEAGVGEVR
jgi:hypothetical protein